MVHELSYPLLPLILDRVADGVRRALAQEGVPCVDRTEPGATGRFVLYDSRLSAGPELAPGQTGIDLEEFAQAEQPDPAEALLDERVDWLEMPFGRRTVRVRCAAVRKRALRRDLLQAIRRKVEQAGGIWLRVAIVPYPYRSVFSLRLDHVRYDAADFVSAMNALSSCGSEVSHYLTGEVLATPGASWARLKDADVGILGYRWEAFRELESLVDNLQRGLVEARDLGFEPSGAATAPGTSAAGLESALEWLGLSHHSGCEGAYDESPWLLPSSRVVRIPVHPVSPADLFDAVELNSTTEEAPHTARSTALLLDMAVMHYCDLLRQRVQTGEPVVVHGPCAGAFGRYPEVLERVTAFARRQGGLWRTNLSGLADWWRARSQIRITVSRRGGRFVVAGRNLPGRYRTAVEYCRDDRVAPMLMSEPAVEFAPEALAYENRSPRDGSVRRRFDADARPPLHPYSRDPEIRDAGGRRRPDGAGAPFGRLRTSNDKR